MDQNTNHMAFSDYYHHRLLSLTAATVLYDVYQSIFTESTEALALLSQLAISIPQASETCLIRYCSL